MTPRRQLASRASELLASLAPAAFLVLTWIALSALADLVGLPRWVPHVLFWGGLLGVAGVLLRRVALARRLTEESLRASEQLVDEPLEVEVPSGVLVLADLAALRSWRGTRAPVDPAVDLALSGPGALESSRALGLDGPYLYDVPTSSVQRVSGALRERVQQHSRGLDVVLLEHRVGHCERAARARELGPLVFNLGSHEVLALNASKVSLVRSWLVTGELDALDLVLDPRPVERSDPLSTLDLNGSALAFADLGALEGFDPDLSGDGRYEVVLTGDLPMASAAGGDLLAPGLWGFSDLTLEETASLVELVGEPGSSTTLIPHSADFYLEAALALEPAVKVDLPGGELHALRTTSPGTRVVSLGYNGDDLVRVRVHFRADPGAVYRLPRPSVLERVLGPVLTHRS